MRDNRPRTFVQARVPFLVPRINAIKAEDNMAVARVTATIRDQANAQVIETLEYVPAVDELAETVLCVLKARTAVPAGHSVLVEADAYDLAGNKCQVTQPA